MMHVMNHSAWWESMLWAALAGALAAIVLRRPVSALIAWLDLRVMPARHLKQCGERRR